MTRQEALALAKKLHAAGYVLYGPKVATVRDSSDDEDRGIVIPDTAKRKPLRGRVIMLGLGLNTEDMEDMLFGCQIGDLVYHTKYNPTLFDAIVDGEVVELEVMHAGDVHMGVQLPTEPAQLELPFEEDVPPYASAPTPTDTD